MCYPELKLLNLGSRSKQQPLRGEKEANGRRHAAVADVAVAATLDDEDDDEEAATDEEQSNKMLRAAKQH